MYLITAFFKMIWVDGSDDHQDVFKQLQQLPCSHTEPATFLSYPKFETELDLHKSGRLQGMLLEHGHASLRCPIARIWSRQGQTRARTNSCEWSKLMKFDEVPGRPGKGQQNKKAREDQDILIPEEVSLLSSSFSPH